ncbi:MAG: TldD/PmbA family protein [Candidatus Eisenbacteria bacterium]|nr:TldD/PmbA family protein [Candidatus Eisenbacteria bacterium]
MHTDIKKLFREVAPAVDFCSLRVLREASEQLMVRHEIPQPVVFREDIGGMVTVIDRGGLGYAATSDLSREGLRRAVEDATEWAKRSAGRAVTNFTAIEQPHPTGHYETPVRAPWQSMPMAQKMDILRQECKRLRTEEKIVDSVASFWYTEAESRFIAADGSEATQRLFHLIPVLSATANKGTETQTRTLGGRGYCQQGGLEVLETVRFRELAPQIATEALALLDAPNCPSGKLDLLLDPDQMILQIHESIGHPLELDRILGDERNYAGTSFVTPEMIGTYQYGSKLLNITFDPSRREQFATYGFDDEGQPAKREFIIKDGILVRALGGTTSRGRSGIPGVANARASGWNRPPIDRMANLNLEPGDSTLEQMIAAVEDGVYMKANRSWSIDDSRNKFQFGCEWARRIEKGKLTTLLKNPNYRGISATFWRNLKLVANASTLQIMGTPYCGKGEPNQMVRVGHAAPACLFAGVDVFGGE